MVDGIISVCLGLERRPKKPTLWLPRSILGILLKRKHLKGVLRMTDRKTESSELDWRSKEEREVYELTGYRLTHRQRAFAERFAEGNCTATQAAIDAGYAPSS